MYCFLENVNSIFPCNYPQENYIWQNYILEDLRMNEYTGCNKLYSFNIILIWQRQEQINAIWNLEISMQLEEHPFHQ